MRKFEDLAVWRDAHRLALNVYDLTARFPAAERFVLMSQMRRSGNSIPGNICEGSGLDSNPQFARHLIIASGSSAELEYYTRLSKDLGYITPDEHEAIRHDIRSVRRQIWGLVRYLRRRAPEVSGFGFRGSGRAIQPTRLNSAQRRQLTDLLATPSSPPTAPVARPRRIRDTQRLSTCELPELTPGNACPEGV